MADPTDTPESVAAGLYARLVIGADPIMQEPAYEMDKLHDALLAAERAQVQAMREALERIRDELARCRGPRSYESAARFSLRVARDSLQQFRPPLQGTKKRQAPSAEQPAPAETAGIRGEPCLRVDVHGDVVRSIHIEPGMTDDEINAAAAVADRLGDGYDLARELAERLEDIVDWADFAKKFPNEFNGHGVGILDGPVFDSARVTIVKARVFGLMAAGGDGGSDA